MESILKITSKTDNLNLVEKFVEDSVINMGIDRIVQGNLLVAAIEATNNAVAHGNKFEEYKHVELSISLNDDFVVLSVSDEGTGFDHTAIPDPTSAENLEKMSGRGIFLMSRLSDKIEFENNASTVKMFFRLSKK
jgi:serine/threonine-protein kinase RsbW